MFRKATLLWPLFVLQLLCSGYFLADITFDWLSPLDPPPTAWGRLADSDGMEAAVTLAMVLGLIFTGSELHRLLRRQARMEDQLQVASGAFAALLETRFGEWGLTDAEQAVALLAIKGYAIAEMADLRDTKQGTIKAQCAALYRKAGVGSRLELLSLFLDDLIAEDLIRNRTKSRLPG